MRFLSSLGRWFKNSSLHKHRFILGAVFLLLGGLVLFGPTHFSLAADDPLDYVNSAYAQMLLWIAGIINGLTAYIAEFSLHIIEIIIVPILQYNNFSSSPTIGLGWSLVRDVVNMFVIIILLVIAIATVVGYKKISWEQALPQFLLAVILVNFSRTICGLLIDISQVVMFTFVNALLDVAAGNFAVLLGYDNFGQYSNSAVRDAVSGTAKYIDAAQQVGAAYMLFVLYASIFAVLLLLALVYIWRIVMLWVLVIMSPLTFFLGGLKGMFKFAEGANGDWWKKFTACLVLGPMLTFFLWLALATGTGDIVQTEGFPAASDSTLEATLVSFETSHLLGTLLGLILLVVGMQQSASFANSMGGVAATVINEKMGRRIVAGIARAPLRAGGELARQTDRRVGQLMGKHSATEFMAGELGGKLSSKVSTLPAGAYLGRAVAGVTGAIQAPIEHQVHAEKQAAKARVSKYTDDQLVQHVGLIAAGKTSAIGLDTRDDIEAIRVKALTDGRFRKKLQKDVGQANYDKLMKESLTMSDDQVKAAGGDAAEFAKAKTQNAHLLKDSDMVKHVQSDKFSGRDLSVQAAADAKVIAAMKDKVVRLNNEGEKVTAYEELIKGAYGKELALAARNASSVSVYDSASAEKGQPSLAQLRPAVADKEGHVTEPERPYTATELASDITAQRINPEKLSAADFDGPNRVPLALAVLDTDSIQKLSAANKEAFAGVIDSLPTGSVSLEQRAKADTAMLNSGSDPYMIGLLPGNINTVGGLSQANELRIEQVIKADPSAVRHLRPGLPTTPDTSNDLSSVIVRNLSVDMIKKLGQQATKASGQELADIRKSLDTISAALQAEKSTATNEPYVQRLDGLGKAHRAAARYLP